MKRIYSRTPLFLVLALAVTLCIAAPAFAGKPTPFTFEVDSSKTKIGEGTYATWSAGFQSLAARGDNTYAVWTDNGINFAFSEDGGRVWGPTVQLSASGDNPTVSAGPDYVHVVWDDPSGILYRRGTLEGGGWSAPVLIDGTYGGSSPSVAADENGNVYAVWEASSVIYVSTSANYGSTWGNIYQVSSITTSMTHAAIDVDPVTGNVYVAWDGKTTTYGWAVHFTMSINGGTSWSTEVPVSGALYDNHASIAVLDASNIYIFFPSNDSVNCAYTSNGGTSWNQSTVQDALNDGDGGTIAVSPSGDVYIAWYEYGTLLGPQGIYFTKSSDGAQTWDTPMQLDTGGQWPNLAVDSAGKPMVMWSGSNGVISFTRQK